MSERLRLIHIEWVMGHALPNRIVVPLLGWLVKLSDQTSGPDEAGAAGEPRVCSSGCGGYFLSTPPPPPPAARGQLNLRLIVVVAPSNEDVRDLQQQQLGCFTVSPALHLSTGNWDREQGEAVLSRVPLLLDRGSYSFWRNCSFVGNNSHCFWPLSEQFEISKGHYQRSQKQKWNKSDQWTCDFTSHPPSGLKLSDWEEEDRLLCEVVWFPGYWLLIIHSAVLLR